MWNTTSLHILYGRGTRVALHIFAEKIPSCAARKRKVREFIYAERARTWKMARYSKYDGRTEYQISRNELPCAKSPIVRDLIGDCHELSVFKLHVFDTRVARNVI